MTGTNPPAPLTETAPAKVNLTLHVLGRRADGYHELESLVAFADESDRLTLTPQDRLRLAVSGAQAKAAGADGDNLVLKAAQALSSRVENLKLGDFALEKNLPVAAGLGGGSSDAAAALRLLARTNGMASDDPKLYDAARAVGADVPVCLDPRARMMRGIGQDLSPPIAIPALPTVLANPGVALSTRDVFAALTVNKRQPSKGDVPRHAADLRGWLAQQQNDLEAPSLSLQPVIGDVLAALSHWGAELSRMSGSGATCFGIFATPDAARAAALALTRAQPNWWVRATMLR